MATRATVAVLQAPRIGQVTCEYVKAVLDENPLNVPRPRSYAQAINPPNQARVRLPVNGVTTYLTPLPQSIIT